MSRTWSHLRMSQGEEVRKLISQPDGTAEPQTVQAFQPRPPSSIAGAPSSTSVGMIAMVRLLLHALDVVLRVLNWIEWAAPIDTPPLDLKKKGSRFLG